MFEGNLTWFLTGVMHVQLDNTKQTFLCILVFCEAQVSDRAWVLKYISSNATKFNDFKHIVGKREFLWANHYTKIFCFCVHSGAPDLIYPETSLYEHIL